MRHRKISLILTVIATLSFMLFNQGCIPGAGIQQQSQHENARKLQEQIPAQKYFSSSYVKLIDLNGGDIYPGEKLKALITVINNSSLEVKDVTLEVDIPDVLIADFNLQGFLIESIEAGQEKIIEIPLRVAPDIDKDFTGHIQAVIDRGKDTQYFSEKISFTVFGTAPYIRDKIPIIGLHGIEDSIEIPIELSTYYFDYLCMTLKEFGFETITFKDLLDHIDFGRVLPEKSVIITSDDGFESLYKNAFPILKKYDYKMTVFLATNYIKETEEKRTKNYFDSDRPVPMRPMLIWPEVIEMDSYGCEFLSHSANHIRMGLADEEVFLNELTVSKEDIESRLKKDVLFFAWPYDNHSEEKWPLIEKAGYRGAVRYWGGVEHISSINLMEIKRLEFNSYISP